MNPIMERVLKLKLEWVLIISSPNSNTNWSVGQLVFNFAY